MRQLLDVEADHVHASDVEADHVHATMYPRADPEKARQALINEWLLTVVGALRIEALGEP